MIKNQFSDLVDDLRETHGANLASVILYGSAAAGDFQTNTSDYNLLIALNEIRPRDLRAAQAPMREWHRMGHPLPVYFTVSELQNAADVFPIEFHQMEKARMVLYGTDVLENLKISDKFLRHQTEYELRSKLIQLRRLYIPACQSVEKLVSLMVESLSSFAALFRAVLILRGVEPPVRKPQIIAATVKNLKIDGSSFEEILALRERGVPVAFEEVAANKLFSRYMLEIENVIDAVDNIGQS